LFISDVFSERGSASRRLLDFSKHEADTIYLVGISGRWAHEYNCMGENAQRLRAEMLRKARKCARGRLRAGNTTSSCAILRHPFRGIGRGDTIPRA